MPFRANVLVVGAEGAVARLAAMLEQIGATVQQAPDCLTAMAAIKSDAVELAVLADCRGKFNPIETARVLKSLRRDRYLPVLLVAVARTCRG